MSKILFVKRSSSILAAACCVLYSNSSCEGAKGHSKLPECDVPACSSTINSLNQAMLGARKRNPATGSSDVIEAAVSGAGNSSDILTGCPIDINVLGASTWNLIHTIAEHIPEEPSDEERDRIESFMTNLAFLYPCHVCREDFWSYVTEHPPKATSRDEFALWCCEMHNHVNARLGKEPVKCNRKDLRERWYKNTNPSNEC